MKVNYYEILGVERSASDTEIRQKFRQLARQYHPDRYAGKDKSEAERMFQALTEAVNVLTNPERRRVHDDQLPLTGKNQNDPVQIAKAYLTKGIKAYNEGQYETAREHFEMSVSHDPNNAKAFHYLALAASRNAANIRRSIQAIEVAVQLEPMNPDYLKVAGLLCKRAGLFAKAERYLEEALQWDPSGEEVRAALAEVRHARSDGKEGGKGILDSIFRKG